ncbi:MAG: hypothetical protein WAP57_17185 [Aquabacterium commune]
MSHQIHYTHGIAELTGQLAGRFKHAAKAFAAVEKMLFSSLGDAEVDVIF